MPTDIGRRVEALAAQATRDAASFDPPRDPPDPGAANAYLREGVGPVVALYVEARTGDEQYPFDRAEFDRLESTLNTYLELYAACHGVDLDATFGVREAAELLVDTHNVQDLAVLLTGVPSRASTAETGH